MTIQKRLKAGAKAYDLDNFSQNSFIEDLGISRSLYFDLKNEKKLFDELFPSTRRKLLQGLELLGF